MYDDDDDDDDDCLSQGFLDDVNLGDPAALLCVRGSDNRHLLLLGGQDLLRKGLHGDNNMAIIKIIPITQFDTLIMYLTHRRLILSDAHG